MREVSAELAAAIEAPVRTIRPVLSVDWDGDGHSGSLDDVSQHVTGLRVNRTMTHHLPDEVQVIEGQAAATATVDLAGGDPGTDLAPASRYWSRFNTASPYHGTPRASRDVALSYQFLTATGWQQVPRITGGVMWGLPVNAGDQSATLEIIDARDRLRAMVSVPLVLAEGTHTATTGSMLDTVGHPGLEASWLASYALHTAGYHLAPPPRGDTLLYIPYHGSAQPFIHRDHARSIKAATWSTTAPWHGVRCAFTRGPFFLAYDPQQCADGDPYGWLNSWAKMRTPTTGAVFDPDGRISLRVEVWVRRIPASPTGYGYLRIHPDQDPDANSHTCEITIADTATCTLTNGSSTVTITGPTLDWGSGWNHFGLHLHEPSGTSIWYWNGATTTVAFTPTTAATFTLSADTQLQSAGAVQMAELHAVHGLAADEAWLPDTWQPQATVDRLQNRLLSGNVSTTPLQAWDLLSQLATAEYGLLWVDADGIPQVWSRRRLLATTALTACRQVTSRQSILDLAYDDRRSQLRNRIRVPSTDYSTTSWGVIWSQTTLEAVAPYRTWTKDITFDAVVSSDLLLNTTVVIGTPGGPSGSTAHQIADNRPTFDADVQITWITDVTARVSITNHEPWWAWLCDFGGVLDMTLEGVKVVTAETRTVDLTTADSIDAFGENTLDVEASGWIQTEPYAQGLAYSLLAGLDHEQIVLTTLTIPGDPRLEPWDRIRVADTHGLILDTEVLVEADNDTWSAGGYDQSLTVRPARPPWILGPPGTGTPHNQAIMGEVSP